jgi:hypothetical protein
MRIPASLKSEFNYSRKLFEAGLNAATSVRADAPNQNIASEFARAAWVPAVVGATIGVLYVCIARKDKSRRRALVGASVGGVLGFAAGVTWDSRKATATIVRQAAKNIGTVNDGHWLEKNPIAYA